jgi:starch synthase
MISRLVDQKGFDLFAAVVEPLLHASPLQIVILGTGQPHYHALLEGLQARYPERIHAWLTFDAELAHRIYAGADLFLMPSRFEPCGLGQMIAMRYGTVPIVRATGGLVDTVREGPPDAPGTGFVFWDYRTDTLLEAIHRALAAHGRPAEWSALRENALRQDHSWEHSAQAYADLYGRAVAIRRAL